MIISLCSGYGGLDRAVAARFRMPVAAHAEPEKITIRSRIIDNPVRAVLAARFPGVPNLGDIREVDWAPWFGLCRVLCAGFPCQPVSAAGRQLAEDDDRWLWPSVHRAIVELAPEWIVLENVANIISIQGGRIWRLILAELQAAGYGVAWGIFGACLVGACHHRHRMFLVAHRGAQGALRWSGQPCGARRGATLPTPTARDSTTRGEGSAGFWEAKRATGWTGGAPLGAELALLPTPAARDGDSSGMPGAGLAGARWPSGRRNLDDGIALLPTPRARDGAGGPGHGVNKQNGVNYRNNRGEPGGIASAVQPEHWGRFTVAVDRWAGTHGAPPTPTEAGPRGGVRMAAPFPEWMMGLAPGYVTGILPRNDALRAIGNGVMPQQGYHAIGELISLLIAP